MHLRCKVQNDLVAIYRPSDGGDWVVTFCKRAAQVLLRRKLESGEVFDVDMTVTERPKNDDIDPSRATGGNENPPADNH